LMPYWRNKLLPFPKKSLEIGNNLPALSVINSD
jgi:hypothetical protein